MATEFLLDGFGVTVTFQPSTARRGCSPPRIRSVGFNRQGTAFSWAQRQVIVAVEDGQHALTRTGATQLEMSHERDRGRGVAHGDSQQALVVPGFGLRADIQRYGWQRIQAGEIVLLARQSSPIEVLGEQPAASVRQLEFDEVNGGELLWKGDSAGVGGGAGGPPRGSGSGYELQRRRG